MAPSAGPGYRLLLASPDEDWLELHVLARAYRDAWRALHGGAPTGEHRLERLGISIDFDAAR